MGCVSLKSMVNSVVQDIFFKNIERHTAHTIVSWPNPKQWVLVHTSDLMMKIRQRIYILSIIFQVSPGYHFDLATEERQKSYTKFG